MAKVHARPSTRRPKPAPSKGNQGHEKRGISPANTAGPDIASSAAASRVAPPAIAAAVLRRPLGSANSASAASQGSASAASSCNGINDIRAGRHAERAP